MGVNLNPTFKDAPFSSILSSCPLWLCPRIDPRSDTAGGGEGVEPHEAEHGDGRGGEDGSVGRLRQLCQLPALPQVLVVRLLGMLIRRELQVLPPLSALRRGGFLWERVQHSGPADDTTHLGVRLQGGLKFEYI